MPAKRKASTKKAAPSPKKQATPKKTSIKASPKSSAKKGSAKKGSAKKGSAKKGDKLTLQYWDGRGLMEVPRVLLALAGKFPGDDYTDGRFKGYTDENKDLAWNNGRMPILHDAHGSVGQSHAINFYVAHQCKLLGKNPLETAQILSIQETIKELKDAYGKIVPYGETPTKEQTQKWFTAGASDRGPAPADMATRGDRQLTWFTGRLEDVVGDKFAVGGALSLADVLIYNCYAETLEKKQAGLGMFDGKPIPKWRCEPFADKASMNKLLAKFPKIKAICDSVAANPNMKKWLASRGVQHF